ncbi:unnamed protein product [Owenia fusiformis]|uniref:Uncharacterized protein n=1 Tax=Owenia fusiformis TaxID=6347 RepID=A0A8J1TZM2_OWEFU|nr:unnamed protein product [Owenia fusiformis]
MATGGVLPGPHRTLKPAAEGKCTTKLFLFSILMTCVIVIISLQYKYMTSVTVIQMLPKINGINNLIKGYLPGPYTLVGPDQKLNIEKGNFTAKVLVDEHGEEGFQNHHSHILEITDRTIAIGGGITTRGLKELTAASMASKLPLFKRLLPSFCKTASKGFSYHYYLAHDHNDPYFSLPNSHEMFSKEFNAAVEKHCPSDIPVRVHLVRCSHAGKPAWAQNDAMWAAYLDDIPFFYRVNDDSDMMTGGWSEVFTETLKKYTPPYVGVVGPAHSGGNTAILTYDFTHKTHLDIFGIYYPRVFTDWYADDWVTKVYRPDRSTKCKDIKLKHTMETGTRYKVDFRVGQKLQAAIDSNQKILKRYIKYRNSTHPTKDPKSQKIISMSLYSNKTSRLIGAVRSAQLTPVMFPGWTARFYIEKTVGISKYDVIPENLIRKLQLLGAQILYVDTQATNVSPELWPYLVSDDSTVERFIIRNVTFRMTDREFTAVEEWTKSKRTFHCIRDHPSHTTPIIPDLIGGVNSGIKTLFSGSWLAYLGQDFLENLWENQKEHFYCHDSFTCKSQPQSFPFVSPREGDTFIGETYDGYHRPIDNKDVEALTKAQLVPQCLDPKSTIDVVGLPKHVTIIPSHPPADSDKSPVIPDAAVKQPIVNVTSFVQSAANSTKLSTNGTST